MSKKSMILYIIAAVIAVSGIAALAKGNTTGGIECILVAAVVAGVGIFLQKRAAGVDNVENHEENYGKTEAKTDGERLLNTIRTKIVGVTFDNEDGVNRQDIVRGMAAGDEITIEPYTFKGEPAAYVRWRGKIAGNLSAELAAEISQKYSKARIKGTVLEITGGDELTYGCNIELKIWA